MTKNEFLAAALTQIKDTPIERISNPVKEALKDKNCMFDTHCHIFDRQCINISYFLLRFIQETAGLESTNETAKYFDKDALGKLGYKYLSKTDSQIYKRLAKKPQEEDADWNKIETELARIQEASELEVFSLGGIWGALSVLLKQEMKGVLNYYLSNIALKNIPELSGRSFITSILMMDLERGKEKILFLRLETPRSR